MSPIWSIVETEDKNRVLNVVLSLRIPVLKDLFTVELPPQAHCGGTEGAGQVFLCLTPSARLGYAKL